MHHENTLARSAYALALTLALSILCLMALPFTSYANDAQDDVVPQVVVDKADFYSEDPSDDSDALELMSGITPMSLSDEMKYFAKWESSQNYAQTFGAGDGYNAMGYYQFDRRYGLQNFIVACYNYDPVTFEMFAPYAEIDPETELYVTSIKKMTIREEIVEIDPETGEESKKKQFTEEAQAVIDAWTAAYEADPVTFAGLQDAWAYELYYLPARDYLLSYHGIDLNERADCVKGLCWGMSNLFGTSGWRKFVGGVSDGYDWEGVYHELEEGIVWPGCGLTPDMTDTEFVTALCDYAIENIPVFYKGQPQYHQGWVNRYMDEKAMCLGFLPEEEIKDEKPELGDVEYTYAPDIAEGAWYVESYEFVMSHGIMNGNDDGTFKPNRNLKREEAAAVLYNYLGNGELVPATDHRDVKQGSWYSAAVNWCVAKGYITGHAGTDRFGVGESLTRQQLACIVARVANADLAAADGSKFQSLPDCGKTNSWARESVVWAVGNGVINGKDAADGTKHLAPQDAVTRAQMAAIMMNSISGGIL